MSEGVTGLFHIYEYIDSIYKYALVYLQVEYICSAQYLHQGRHMYAHDRTASQLGVAPRPMTSWELSPPSMSYFGVAVLAPVKVEPQMLLIRLLLMEHRSTCAPHQTHGHDIDTRRSYDTWSVCPLVVYKGS